MLSENETIRYRFWGCRPPPPCVPSTIGFVGLAPVRSSFIHICPAEKLHPDCGHSDDTVGADLLRGSVQSARGVAPSGDNRTVSPLRPPSEIGI
jgi:hypothetical protein